ncbi:MAG: hypothetical protein ACK5LN_14145 [Propioniciclava sp.]
MMARGPAGAATGAFGVATRARTERLPELSGCGIGMRDRDADE